MLQNASSQLALHVLSIGMLDCLLVLAVWSVYGRLKSECSTLVAEFDDNTAVKTSQGKAPVSVCKYTQPNEWGLERRQHVYNRPEWEQSHI